MILTIFGATGDLARRMLFPSLYHLHKQGRLPSDIQIVGFARKEFTHIQFCDYLSEEFKSLYPNVFSQESWQKFCESITYFQGDLSNEEDFVRLGKKLALADTDLQSCTDKIFYLAISPDLYPQTFSGIRKSQLESICEHSKHVRVVIEKPFGKSLKSYYELNDSLMDIFNEDQIYRIDHYLGKETVKNILNFRAANPLFFNDWNKNTIDRIDVKVMESLGVGTRAEYYDEYGQMRDLVQSHSLQLLSLVMAELPDELTAEKIRNSKTSILQSLFVENLENDVVRGQYGSGIIDGVPVKSYKEEHEKLSESKTETYVHIKAHSNLEVWDGVDINLISGKRMQSKESSITLHFKSQERVKGIPSKNKLIFQLQPSEGITLDLQVKKPGLNELEVVPMVFKYQDNFRVLLPDAYESLLLDIFKGNKSSFISNEELEASWKFIDPILERWNSDNNHPVIYPSGSKQLRIN
jgi:glucose-6-phosphate 1-dehydrogenase